MISFSVIYNFCKVAFVIFDVLLSLLFIFFGSLDKLISANSELYENDGSFDTVLHFLNILLILLFL